MKKMSIRVLINILIFLNGIIVSCFSLFDFFAHAAPSMLSNVEHTFIQSSQWLIIDILIFLSGLISAIRSLYLDK